MTGYELPKIPAGSNGSRNEPTIPFDRLDSTSDATQWREFLKTVAVDPIALKCYEISRNLMNIGEGCTVLEIGSGSCPDKHEILRIIQPSGQLLLVDRDQKLLDQARDELSLEFSRNVALICDDITTGLTFPDKTINSCRASRVLQHLRQEQVKSVVNEMKRVTKSGGNIVVIDPDWMSLTIGTDDYKVEQALMQNSFIHVNNPDIARTLPVLLAKEGFISIKSQYIASAFRTYNSFDYIFQISDRLSKLVGEGILNEGEAESYIAKALEYTEQRCFFARNTMCIISATVE